MRTHATFHTLIVLMAVLTVSTPFVALAQQNPIQTEAEVAAGLLAAKAAAEQDASNDVNKFLWFGAGMGLAAIGITVGTLTGCLVGSMINPETDGWYGVPVPNEAQIIGPLIGSTLGCLASPIGISRYSSNPPAERLLGKSPEYVEAYTNAYRPKARSLRTSSATVGAAIVGGGLGLCLFGAIQ